LDTVVRDRLIADKEGRGHWFPVFAYLKQICQNLFKEIKDGQGNWIWKAYEPKSDRKFQFYSKQDLFLLLEKGHHQSFKSAFCQ